MPDSIAQKPIDKLRLSIVIPCYNEAEVLVALEARILRCLEALGVVWEVILVNEGSSDRTYEMLAAMHGRDPRFKVVSLSRNFGHQPAVWTGLQHARGQCIGVIDCDLQDPPEVLLELYQKVAAEGFDVCAGVRGKREDSPWWLRAAYKIFYRVMNWMAEHDYTLDSGDFCVFNQRAHQALLRMGEAAPVHRGLRSWIGFKQTTLSYRRPPRQHGTTKYNVRRLTALAINNLVSFSTAPLRLATWVGLIMGIITLVAAIFFLLNRLFPSFSIFGYHVGANAGTATLVLYLSFISSALFFCMGIIGEYLAVIIKEVKRRPVTVVAECTDDDATA